MAYAPTLTVSTDAAPAPRGLVNFAALAATTQTIEVSKVVEGRTFKVRGGVGLFAVGGASVMDYEPAFGVPNSYRAEMFNAAGVSLGFTDAAAATLAPGDVVTGKSRAWISQPLNPSMAIQCTLLLGTAAQIGRSTPGETIYPEGATVGVQIGGQRRGIQGMTVRLLCDSLADADEFESMFGGYSSDYPAVICIRTIPPIRLPRLLFAAVPSVTEVAYADASKVVFEMTIDEVQPPSPGLIIPTLRRMDIDAAYPTRAARAAAYATRLERDTDYSLAGLAG